MKRSAADIVREYGPFPDANNVGGVTYDGQHVWFAGGGALVELDPASGEALRSIDVPAHAGTAFDGRYLFQIAEDRIQKIDPQTGKVLATIPAPGAGATPASPGPRARCGSGNTGSARSNRSTRTPAPSCAPLNRTALSPASPGSTANSGMARGKAIQASYATSIRTPGKYWS